MKFYYLRCLNQDGQTERNGNFLDRKEAEKEKAALDLYPENKRYGIEQDIIEDSVMDIVKRHPGTNGVLPMTESDLKGLTKAYRYDFSILKAVSVRLSLTHLELVWDRLPPEVIENVAAILYLAERFELGGKKDV